MQTITVTQGGVRVTADGRDFLVGDWAQALEALKRVRGAENWVAVLIDSQGSRQVSLVQPQTGDQRPAEEGMAPQMFMGDVPWIVSAPSLGDEDTYHPDAAGAYASCQMAVDLIDEVCDIEVIKPPDNEVTTKTQMRPSRAAEDDTPTQAMPLTVIETPPDDYDGIIARDDYDDDYDGGYSSEHPLSEGQGYEPRAGFDDDDDDGVAIPVRVSGTEVADPYGGRRRKIPAAFVTGAIIFVALLALAVIIPSVMDFGDEEPTAEETIAPLDRPALSPWSQDFSWTFGVDPSGRVGSTPDGAFAGLISSDGRFAIVNSSSGELVASADTPLKMDVGPRGTTLGGKQALVGRAGNVIFAWHEGQSEIMKFDATKDVGAASSVTFTGMEPLVLSKDAVKAFRITDAGLEEVKDVPEGGRPYAMNAKGKLILGKADPARVTGKDGKDVGLEKPTKGKDSPWHTERWMYVSDSYALILWKEEERGTDSGGMLALHSVADGKILQKVKIDDVAAMKAAGVVTNEQGGTYAVPGHTFVVDPDGRKATIASVPDFTPSSIVGDVVFGKDKNGRAVVRLSEDGAQTEQIDAAVLVPWVTNVQGSGIVVSGGIAYCLDVEGAAEGTPTPAAPEDVPEEKEEPKK